MKFMDWIIEELEDIADFFYEAYQEVKDWWSPFDLLKYPLYGIYGRFRWLAEWFEDFRDWLAWAADELDEILSWSSIRSMIRSWLYKIEDALDWFLSWTYWVRQEIREWWSSQLPYILDYIDSVVEGWEDFAANWDDFWNNIYPNLISFTWLTTWWNSKILDVQKLINTAFTLRESFWEGWQEVRDKVTNFFADPLEWLLTQFTDWFLGKEE